jgi:anti-sigma factor RsiW
MPNRLSMFRRIHTRMSWASLNVGAPRSVFQAETVYPPGHAEGHTGGVDMKVWSHGPYKCAVIVRIQTKSLPIYPGFC